MNLSFYSSGVNAAAQQEKLNVIANNMANMSTVGFKKGNTVFTDLYYQNIRPPADNEDTTVKSGSGVKIQQVTNDYTTAGLMETGGTLDYALSGEGFFAIQNTTNNTISYTRDGSFYSSQAADGKFYMMHAASGGRVLDSRGNPIEITDGATTFDIGVYNFNNYEGLISNGNNTYSADIKSGTPYIETKTKAEQGKLEMSNVDLSEEMSKMIVAQRAYSMNLKMLQVSDEIVQEVNKFR